MQKKKNNKTFLNSYINAHSLFCIRYVYIKIILNMLNVKNLIAFIKTQNAIVIMNK